MGISVGLQAQTSSDASLAKKACKKVCTKSAEGQSVSLFTSLISNEKSPSSCSKVAAKANCNPANCNPANCKPANCKPASCKPASQVAACSKGKKETKVVLASSSQK